MDHTQPQPIRPVPPMPPIAAADAPLVLVVETLPGLGAMLAELSDFLRIRVGALPGAAGLAQALRRQPIAVLIRLGAATTSATLSACLARIAAHDPGLPVLLLIETAGTDAVPTPEDALAPAGRLSNLYWMDGDPGIKRLVEFLFMAERRRGLPGLMPA